MDNLLGRADIASVARNRILEAAEGNPLFVEEMLGMLIDDGLLRFDGDTWRGVDDLEQVTVPPTIQLLLAARLDRLDADERAVMERGSVEGKIFTPVPWRRCPLRRCDPTCVHACSRSRARS